MTATVSGIHLGIDTHANRPAAGTPPVGSLYSCSTHSLVYRTDGSTWSTWATLGGAAVTDATITTTDVTTNNVSTSKHGWAPKGDANAAHYLDGTGAYSTPAGTAADDPVASMLGTPDTAFEFDSSSLTGLTAIGTATAEDANTTISGCYYVKKAATASVAVTGRYAAVSAPCTVVTKLKAHNVFGTNFLRLGGLFVGTATPGRLDAIHIVFNSGWIGTLVAYTNPTTFSATIGSDIPQPGHTPPVYYAIVATSTTNVAYYYSWDGISWTTHTSGRDPSITIGSAGIVVDPEQATHSVAAGYEYLRIWNSAKTLIGG